MKMSRSKYQEIGCISDTSGFYEGYVQNATAIKRSRRYISNRHRIGYIETGLVDKRFYV